ncbi:hypothetical protein MPSEU_000867300 [Mayamaea pseudoterrestris]|nr:hypothetical protein MPSEU_000867300 [Mayamaea pseudoterrestris]
MKHQGRIQAFPCMHTTASNHRSSRSMEIGKRCTVLLALLVLPLTTTEAFIATAASPHHVNAAAGGSHKRQRNYHQQLSSTMAHEASGLLSSSSCATGSCAAASDKDARKDARRQGVSPFTSLGAWFALPSSSSSLRKKQRDDSHSNHHHHHKTTSKSTTYSDYQRRKNDWARKYCSVDSLRSTFGSNANKLWGDLDAPTARRLYKTLLPKALLDLYKLGVEPSDLAPLAYRARVAAKLYARERCQVPARLLAHWYDGFRTWRRYGSFDMKGMTYQQVWEKYSHAVATECAAGDTPLSEHDVTAMICCKILEKSCTTNEMVDRLVLSHAKGDLVDQADLAHFTDTLERDVRLLLKVEQERATAPSKQLGVKRFKMLKRIVRLKQQVRKQPAAANKQQPKDVKTKDWE